MRRSARKMRAPVIRDAKMPAPIGGLNTLSAGAAMPATDCVQLWNLIPAEYGLRSRLGSREWVTGLTGAADSQVRSTLAFHGSAQSGSLDRLFAVTSSGIWDVSASTALAGGATPDLELDVNTGDAGYGESVGFVGVDGAHYLLYCDEENGYHVYSEAGDAWAAVAMGGGAGQVGGVDPANLVFVCVWKARVWFVERDSTRAWYLEAGALYGAATSFDFGLTFRNGGSLVGLYNWTVDGGAGLDDLLVAVSSAGDVAIYQGTDPASVDTFALKGVWSTGGVPAGRRIVTTHGGDLLLLTKSGIRALSRLISGGEGQGTYETAKIGNLFNSLMLSRATQHGWGLHLHPEDAALLVTVPTVEGQPTEQLVQALWNRSWSRYRDLPIFSAAVWAGKLHFGTADGRVLVNDGYVDGVQLADANAWTPVQFALLTSFQNLGNARNKLVSLIRATLLSEAAAPRFNVAARYKFDFTELAPVSGASLSGAGWDSAVWDLGVWGGDYQATQEVRGAVGCGVDVAIALRGQALARTVLTGFDVGYEEGGLL